VTGIAAGTPVATLSASTNGSGLVLDAANSSIQSLRNSTLTLGGTTTGDIVLDSGVGTVRLADLTTDGVVYTSGANGRLNSETQLNLTRGGTGLTINPATITDGQLLIGNDTANGFTLANLTAGSGISIANASGSITISQTGSGASKWTQNNANGVLSPNISTLD